MAWRRWLCLLLLSAFGPAAHAQQVLEAEEHKVRAALLFNFAKFVTWPSGVFSDNRSPFFICVLGEDRVFDALVEIAASKRVRRRRIVSRVFAAAKDVERCHILFYSLDRLSELQAHRARWAESHILTVGEIDGFATAGGAVGLSIVENRFTFEINSGAARRAGLQISAGLLALATRVIDEGAPR